MIRQILFQVRFLDLNRWILVKPNPPITRKPGVGHHQLDPGSESFCHHAPHQIEAGKLTPIINQTHSLGQVPEAIRYVETGHARGKVVISLETNGF